MGVPVAVQPRFEATFFILGCQQVADSGRQRKHFEVVVAAVIGVSFGIQNRRSQDRIGEVSPAGPRFQGLQVRGGFSVHSFLHLCGSRLEQLEIARG